MSTPLKNSTPINKSLLTPCRRVGLSRIRKTPDSIAKLIKDTPVDSFSAPSDSPKTPATLKRKETLKPSLDSPLAEVLPASPSEVKSDVSSKCKESRLGKAAKKSLEEKFAKEQTKDKPNKVVSTKDCTGSEKKAKVPETVTKQFSVDEEDEELMKIQKKKPRVLSDDSLPDKESEKISEATTNLPTSKDVEKRKLSEISNVHTNKIDEDKGKISKRSNEKAEKTHKKESNPSTVKDAKKRRQQVLSDDEESEKISEATTNLPTSKDVEKRKLSEISNIHTNKIDEDKGKISKGSNEKAEKTHKKESKLPTVKDAKKRQQQVLSDDEESEKISEAATNLPTSKDVEKRKLSEISNVHTNKIDEDKGKISQRSNEKAEKTHKKESKLPTVKDAKKRQQVLSDDEESEKISEAATNLPTSKDVEKRKLSEISNVHTNKIDEDKGKLSKGSNEKTHKKESNLSTVQRAKKRRPRVLSDDDDDFPEISTKKTARKLDEDEDFIVAKKRNRRILSNDEISNSQKSTDPDANKLPKKSEKSLKNKLSIQQSLGEDGDDDFVTIKRKKVDEEILATSQSLKREVSRDGLKNISVKLRQLSDEDLTKHQTSKQPTETIIILDDDDDEAAFTSTPKEEQTERADLLSNIGALELRMKEKRKTLDDLKRAATYKKMHNIEELTELVEVWRKGCVNGLTALLEKLQAHSPLSMETLLSNLHIPSEIAKTKLKLL